MLTFQLERASEVRAEMEPLLLPHWREIALNQDSIALDPDFECYLRYERDGLLFLETARDDGKLVGYYIGLIAPHLHYKSTLMAHTDIYRLLPEYRRGTAGIELFRSMEKLMQARGVRKISAGTKLHKDAGKLFQYLGWQKVEEIYTKELCP